MPTTRPAVGCGVGLAVGAGDGILVGCEVGLAVGKGDGRLVGFAVGLVVGGEVQTLQQS